MLRLISREVPRVATLKREGLILLICMFKRLNKRSKPTREPALARKAADQPRIRWVKGKLSNALILQMDKICPPNAAVKWEGSVGPWSR